MSKTSKLAALLCLIAVAAVVSFGLPPAPVSIEANDPPAASPHAELIARAHTHNPELLRLSYRRERMLIDRDRTTLLPGHPIYDDMTKAVFDFDKTILATRARLAHQVTDLLWQFELAGGQISLQQRTLSGLRERLRLEEERLRAGLSTEIMLESLRLTADSAALSLARLLDTRDILRMNINLLLARDPGEPLVVEASLTYTPVEVDLLAGIEKALSGPLSPVVAAREAYEKARMDYLSSYNPEQDPWGHLAAQTHVRRFKVAAEEAETDYNQARRAAEASLRTRYLELNTARLAVELAERELAHEENKLALEERKLAAGLSTGLAVAEQLNRTVAARHDYLNRIYQHQRILSLYRLAEQGL